MRLPSTPSLLVEAGDIAADPAVVPDDASVSGDCLLVPLLTPAASAVTDQLRVAASLSRASDARLCVVDPTNGDPTAYGPELSTDAERDLIERTVRRSPRPVTPGPGFVRMQVLLDGILATVRRDDVGTVVIPSGSDAGFLRRNLAERLALRAACDVVTVNGQRSYEDARSILLAVTGGPHSEAAADVARRLAADTDAWVDILHVVTPRASDRRRERATDYVEAAFDRIGRPERTTTWVLEADSVADAIVEQSEYYGLTVLGAPTKGRLRELIAGSTNRTVRRGAESAVVSVRANQ